MTLSHAILRDLIHGQTTASSAAGRLKIETSHAQTLLNRHVTDGNATTNNYSGLTTFQITDKGREIFTPKSSS